MDAREIRIELLKKGLNYTRISNILNVSTTSVAGVARRIRTSHRIAIAISTALGSSTEAVFPDVPEYHRPYMNDAKKREASQKLDSQLKDLKLTGTY